MLHKELPLRLQGLGSPHLEGIGKKNEKTQTCSQYLERVSRDQPLDLSPRPGQVVRLLAAGITRPTSPQMSVTKPPSPMGLFLAFLSS